MPILGDLIRYSITNKRRKKAIEEFLKQFPEQQQPFAGKKVSELAAVLGGVGESMPIPEHMGGNALPFSPEPTLRPDQMRQMTPPSLINPQNAQLAKAKALVRSGYEPGEEAGLKMLLGGEEKPDEWARASDTIIFNKADGSYRELPAGTLKLKENEIAMRFNPETGEFEEVAKGLPKATTPPKPDYVAAETSPGKYTLVPRDFAAAHGLTIKKDQQGISMGYDAEGRPTVQIGGVPSVASGNMAKPTQAAVETELLNAEKGLLRIDRILGSYDESYLNAPKQWQNWLRDKWERAGLSLSEAGTKELAGYATFESYTLENLNRYIKEITGAQMSEAEAERLMKSMPQMGEGKTRFRAKLLAIQAALKANHDAFYSALRRGESRERALAAADSASQDAYNFYVTKEGGDFFAGPKEMPAAPAGYQWQRREDGVNVLVRAD